MQHHVRPERERQWYDSLPGVGYITTERIALEWTFCYCISNLFFSVVFIVRIVYNVYNEYNVRNVHNVLILIMYGYIIICVATINLFYLCEIVYSWLIFCIRFYCLCVHCPHCTQCTQNLIKFNWKFIVYICLNIWPSGFCMIICGKSKISKYIAKNRVFRLSGAFSDLGRATTRPRPKNAVSGLYFSSNFDIASPLALSAISM